MFDRYSPAGPEAGRHAMSKSSLLRFGGGAAPPYQRVIMDGMEIG